MPVRNLFLIAMDKYISSPDLKLTTEEYHKYLLTIYDAITQRVGGVDVGKDLNVKDYFTAAGFINRYLNSHEYSEDSVERVSEILKILDSYKKFAIFNLYTPVQLNYSLLSHKFKLERDLERSVNYTYTYFEIDEIYKYLEKVIPSYVYPSCQIYVKYLRKYFPLSTFKLDFFVGHSMPHHNSLKIELCGINGLEYYMNPINFRVTFVSDNVTIYQFDDALTEEERAHKSSYPRENMYLPLCIHDRCERTDTINGLCPLHR